MSKGTSNHWAFTLTELMVVIAVVALLTIMLLHTQASTRADAQRIQCVNNLKQVGLAFRLWAANHNDEFPMAVGTSDGGTKPASGPVVNGWETFKVFLVMSNELITPKVVLCPVESERRAATNFNPGMFPGGDFADNLRVSYFDGRDADQTRPRMLLAGDRNIYGPATSPTSNNGYGNSPSGYDASGRLVAMTTNGNSLNTVGWTDKLHAQQGNVTMTDGSVQQFNTFYLREALSETGDEGGAAANTILFP